MVLPGFGKARQDRLLAARVLVVGVGGLGSPALQYLAAAGIGKIGIIDYDFVELSNLQRQTIFSMADLGKSKAVVAKEKINQLNPELAIDAYPEKLTTRNGLDLVSRYDLVLDGTDNFSTRYLINDACVLLGKPFIYGAVLRYEGQVAVFNLPDPKQEETTNYRDLFPAPPSPQTVPNCNEAGVLGVLPGIIGTMQAAEAIKICTGIGKPLLNTMLTFNLLNNSFFSFAITKAAKKNAVYPATPDAFRKFNYEWFCGQHINLPEMTANAFDILRKKEELLVIDVRELGEEPIVQEFSYVQIPLSKWPSAIDDISPDKKIIFFCLSGVRSQRALAMFKERFPMREAYSLHGGIIAWKEQQILSPIKQ